MSGPERERTALLSTAAPNRGAVRLAVVTVVFSLVAAVATWPFATLDLGGGAPALVAYGTAVLMIDVLTAILLLTIHAAEPSRAILVLAIGYLFTGVATAPWLLTFPGIFSETGLLGAGLQTTAVIAAGRRIGFALAILGYAALAGSDAFTALSGKRGIVVVLVSSLGFALALAAFAVGGGDALPSLMASPRQTTVLWDAVPVIASLVCAAAAALLFRRRLRCALDLWLVVVLATQLIEMWMLALTGGGTRFSLGWWAGRAAGFVSSGVVLVVLIVETMTVYDRLLRASRAAQRLREAQLSGMEALAGAIAHEVKQPLASIVTNAGAALRWLDRPEAGRAEARAALERISGEAHRAANAVDGVRTLLGGRALGREAVDLNRLVLDALAAVKEDAELSGVGVQTRFTEGLPPVHGDRGMLLQVIHNLAANAIDAMRGMPGPRLLTAATGSLTDGSVVIRIEDTGAGIAPELAERIFQPFFTTKPGGIGLGLLIAQSAVQAHGGAITVRETSPHGASFQVVLPAAVAGPPQVAATHTSV